MEVITNHVERAIALLVEQFRDSPQFQALLSAFVGQLQELEDVFDALDTLRWVDSAHGAQLDGLGALVTEPRYGREDADYRKAIRLRVAVNSSKGLPNLVIEFVKAYTGSSVVIYESIFPAAVKLTLNGAAITVGLIAEIERILPVAVGLSLFASDVPNPIAFQEEVGAQLGGYFSDDDITDGGGQFLDDF